MKKVRYGIIGFGGIAESRIAKEGFGCDSRRFRGNPRATLVGATDLNHKRKSAATALGVKWYENADDLLADPRIEAVFIATNNLSHAPLALKAMQKGKHVITDKPMATRLGDGVKLVNAARRHGVSLAVDHMMTCNPYNIKANQLIRSGAVGRVNDIVLHMEFLYGATPEEARTWRCAKPQEIGGPIGDIASHCLYMAEFLLDSRIKRLGCVYTPKYLKIKVEDGAFIQFETINGIQGSVRVGFNQPRGGMLGAFSNLGYEVYGDKGVLRSYACLHQFSGHKDEPIALRLEIDRFSSQRTVKPARMRNSYQEIIARHALSIRNNAPLTGKDGLWNLKLVLAAHASARQNGKMIVVK